MSTCRMFGSCLLNVKSEQKEKKNEETRLRKFLHTVPTLGIV